MENRGISDVLRFFLSGGGGGGGSLYTGYAGSTLASVYKLKDVVYAIFILLQSVRKDIVSIKICKIA